MARHKDINRLIIGLWRCICPCMPLYSRYACYVYVMVYYGYMALWCSAVYGACIVVYAWYVIVGQCQAANVVLITM